MNKKILTLTLFFVFCLSSFCFSATNEDELSLYYNDTINLKTYFQQASIDFNLNEDTIIQASNKHLFSIDEYFNLTASSIGETLLILANDNDLFYLTISIKSPIKAVEFNDADLVLLAGEIYPLNYKLIPQDDYHKPINQQLKWKSSKSNIVGVKAENRLYTHQVGSTTLTGTAFDGTTSININVLVVANTDKITTHMVVDNFVKVGENRQLSAYFGTKDVTKSVEWESNFEDIATVDKNGLVRPLKAGTVVITAKSSITNKSKDYQLFVRSMVSKIDLDRSSIVFENLGDIQKLNTTLTYKDPAITPLLNGYYYVSSNPTVASVDSNGIVTAKGPGLALISVISNDSQLKDNCSVEVIGEKPKTSIDYTPVREIYLTAEDNETIIGKKLLLKVDIEPENATDQTFKFDIRNGDASQIHKINDNYYFVPEKQDNFKIRVVASGGVDEVSDLLEVQVKSPIASLNLDLSVQRGKKSERKLYVGETAEILNDIYTQGLYSEYDVYPNTLKYKVEDTDVLDLQYINGKYYVKALKKGSTTIQVENIQGKHDEHLRVKVSNPVRRIETNSAVRLPIGIGYTPNYSFTPTSSARDISLPFLNKGIKLEVEEFYFSESYIDEEIAYEKKVIEEFTSLPSSYALEASIKGHNTRLSTLELLKNNAKNGYALVTNTFLKDRNLSPYKYYDINKNTITGNYPSKAHVNILINGTSTETSTVLYWQEDNKDFAIKNLTKWQNLNELLKDHHLTQSFASLPEEKQIECLLYYLSHKDFLPSDPSAELLTALSGLKKSPLHDILGADLKAPVTLHELAWVAAYIEQVHGTNKTANIDNIIYYDIINDVVKNTIALGYISPKDKDHVGIKTLVTYPDFKEMVDKVLPNNQLPLSIEKTFNHEQVLLMLNQL